MKKLLLTLAMILLFAGCAAPAEETPTATATPDPLLVSSCQVALLGTWQEDGANARIITIRNFAGIYRLTNEYADGTTESVVLGVKNVDGVVRFYEDAEKLEGEYWTIGKDKALELYDDQGVVKSIPPKGE